MGLSILSSLSEGRPNWFDFEFASQIVSCEVEENLPSRTTVPSGGGWDPEGVGGNLPSRIFRRNKWKWMGSRGGGSLPS